MTMPGDCAEPCSQLASGVVHLDIAIIRMDGGTQCRLRLDERTIREYRLQMEAGADFPPIRVWFDGFHYWLADGFQRTTAAKLAGRNTIAAEIRLGTLLDAEWDCFGANSAHGLPRTRSDAKYAALRAFSHPRSKELSNIQLAKHLGIPEATLRRWRRLSSPGGEDGVRLAVRGGRTYAMDVHNIGKNTSCVRSAKVKTVGTLKADLRRMKEQATPDVRCVLNVIEKWISRAVEADDCLKALENISRRSRC